MSQAVEAYRGITATEEFKHLEWLREKALRDEAEAIHSAEKRGEKRRDEHWQGVVADKDAALADKDALIAELQAKLSEKQ